VVDGGWEGRPFDGWFSGAGDCRGVALAQGCSRASGGRMDRLGFACTYLVFDPYDLGLVHLLPIGTCSKNLQPDIRGLRGRLWGRGGRGGRRGLLRR
jgi:hypothetical protein